MRIGEVLKLRLGDLHDRKLVLREPKSGKEYEFVFIPQKVADRLREYALQACNASNDRIFPNSYEAARIMVIKSGNLVGIKLRPHDLRRHSATFSSRSGLPIEIISKVILRHANLSSTKSFNCVSSKPKQQNLPDHSSISSLASHFFYHFPLEYCCSNSKSSILGID
jgi:integrase/recombinase XerD